MQKSVGIGTATIFVVLASLSFGAISVLTVLTARAGLSLLTAMAWRYLLAIVAMAISVSAAEVRAISLKKASALLLIGGGGQALLTFVSLSALAYIPVASLGFLFYTYPAWVALISAATGAEKLTRWRVAALITALAGVTVMVGAPGAATLNRYGVMLALAASLLYAFYLPVLRKMQAGVTPRAAALLIVVGAAVVFLIGGAASGQLGFPRSIPAWLEIVILAVVSTGVAFTALIAGLEVLGAVRTAIISTVEPFFTALLGVVILGDGLRATTLVGGMLIISAVVLIEWSSSTFRDPSAG